MRLLTDPLLRRRVAHLRHRARRGTRAARRRRRGADLPPSPRPPRPRLAADARAPRRRCSSRAAPVRGCARAASRTSPSWASGESDRRRSRRGHRGRRRGTTTGACPAGPRAPALGFVVRGRRQVYFAGDTELFDGMAELAAGLDVALLPVAGWGPRLGPGHMDALDAARAASMLRPRLAIPVHWGTLRPIIGRRAALDHARRPARVRRATSLSSLRTSRCGSCSRARRRSCERATARAARAVREGSGCRLACVKRCRPERSSGPGEGRGALDGARAHAARRRCPGPRVCGARRTSTTFRAMCRR